MKTYNQRLHKDFYKKVEYARGFARDNDDSLFQESRRLFRLAHGTINNCDGCENFRTKNNRCICFGTRGVSYGDDYTEVKIRSLLAGLSPEEVVDKMKNVVNDLFD